MFIRNNILQQTAWSAQKEMALFQVAEYVTVHMHSCSHAGDMRHSYLAPSVSREDPSKPSASQIFWEKIH